LSPENSTKNVSGNREAENTTAVGKPRKGGPLSGTLGVFIFAVLFATAGYLAWRTFTTAPPPEVDTPEVVYMCAETNKTFMHMPVTDEDQPILSPYSKKNTVYRPESGYWTKDVRQKTEPTYIILNERLGKKEATVCPDCGRLVQPHNPLPPKGTPKAEKPKVEKPKVEKPKVEKPEVEQPAAAE